MLISNKFFFENKKRVIKQNNSEASEKEREYLIKMMYEKLIFNQKTK